MDEKLKQVFALQPKREPPPRWWCPSGSLSFAEMVSAIREFDELIAEDARRRALDLAADAPPCLTKIEKQRAAELIELMLSMYPAHTPAELLWILAADAFRPRDRGPKKIWAGLDGANLVSLVEAGLVAMGLERGARKGRRQRDRAGLRVVIDQLRERMPETYGNYPAERLREAYYEARDALRDRLAAGAAPVELPSLADALASWSGKEPN